MILNYHGEGSPFGVMTEVLDSDIVSSNSSHAIRFTFRLIPLGGKRMNPLIPLAMG